MKFSCTVLALGALVLGAHAEDPLLFEGRNIEKFQKLDHDDAVKEHGYGHVADGHQGRGHLKDRYDHDHNDLSSTCPLVDIREDHGGVVIPKFGDCPMESIPQKFLDFFRCRTPPGCDQAVICYKYVPPSIIEQLQQTCDFPNLDDFNPGNINEDDFNDDADAAKVKQYETKRAMLRANPNALRKEIEKVSDERQKKSEELKKKEAEKIQKTEYLKNIKKDPSKAKEVEKIKEDIQNIDNDINTKKAEKAAKDGELDDLKAIKTEVDKLKKVKGNKGN